jgi:hypothetical protein
MPFILPNNPENTVGSIIEMSFMPSAWVSGALDASPAGSGASGTDGR